MYATCWTRLFTRLHTLCEFIFSGRSARGGVDGRAAGAADVRRAAGHHRGGQRQGGRTRRGLPHQRRQGKTRLLQVGKVLN